MWHSCIIGVMSFTLLCLFFAWEYQGQLLLPTVVTDEQISSCVLPSPSLFLAKPVMLRALHSLLQDD